MIVFEISNIEVKILQNAYQMTEKTADDQF